MHLVHSVLNQSIKTEAAQPTEVLTVELVAFFVRVAESFGFPRSVGEIFGLIYATPRPISVEEINERLTLSKGSISQGLKLLRQLRLIKVSYQSGDRRTFFEPELSLRRLTATILEHTVMPQMREAAEHLERMEVLAAESKNSCAPELIHRVNQLTHWQSRTRRVLPFFLRLLGKSA